MPAPVPYNGNQSRLEYYALNGNTAVNGGLGRQVLLNKSEIMYKKSFKNNLYGAPNGSDVYGLSHTNAIDDTVTPYRGKATNNNIDTINTENGITARYNYKGGDKFDKDGGSAILQAGYSTAGLGLGRKLSLSLNQNTWGYSPDQTGGASTINDYHTPNMSLNKGQVVIP